MKVLITMLIALVTSSTFAKERVSDSHMTLRVISQEDRSITVTNKSDWDLWCDFGYVKGEDYGRLNREERKDYRIVAFEIAKGETETAYAEQLADISPYRVAGICSTGGDPDKRPPATAEQKARSSAFLQCLDDNGNTDEAAMTCSALHLKTE